MVLTRAGWAATSAAKKSRPAAAAGAATYPCNALGFVRHWLVTGPTVAPYDGPAGSDEVRRRKGVDPKIVEPPADAALGKKGPLDAEWRFYDPGENFYVEHTAFYHKLSRIDSYACTELITARAGEIPAKLWAAGHADLWLNGRHLTRHYSRRHPVAMDLKLPLQKGVNRLCVRLQVVSIRDTNHLFGLQLLAGAEAVQVNVPGPAQSMRQIHDALAWLWSVKAEGRNALVSAVPAPVQALIDVNYGKDAPWARGATRATYRPKKAGQVNLRLDVAGQKLGRLLEVPANFGAAPVAGKTPAEHRRQTLERIAAGTDGTIKSVWQVLALRLLGLEREEFRRKGGLPNLNAETAAIDAALRGIDARKDCSDFALSCLLRMIELKLTSAEETARIKKTALAFRYWNDEPGTDVMHFTSENHALLFHGCQLIAGRLWPNEMFSNSKRTGEQQQALAIARILAWLDKTEKNGYAEFLSSTYMPLTVAAMLNLVDFCDDPEITRRAAALTDRIFTDLALQAFDRVTVGPQGRVYRNVLYPRDSGTQALLSYATPEALVATNQWIVYLACSKYQPPAGLEKIMNAPADKTYRHTSAEIIVHKTAGCLLTSLQIPASFAGKPQIKDGKPEGLQPGADGFQQHLWHATLGRDCHVFVNNPGASFDLSAHRPGYWYGNGTIPGLKQKGGVLQSVFNLPESNPIPFTHAHWPADAFDRQQVEGHWAFGMKGGGCVALWCSETLTPHDEVLTGRELRALGRRVAWVCICADTADQGNFERFKKYCESLTPRFDEKKLSLDMK